LQKKADQMVGEGLVMGFWNGKTKYRWGWVYRTWIPAFAGMTEVWVKSTVIPAKAGIQGQQAQSFAICSAFYPNICRCFPTQPTRHSPPH